jgi:hypothetical protein
MNLFKFTIHKNANFAYWSQLLLGKWSWYFEKENSGLFTAETGILTETEQKALNELRSILQKEENQYQWLWERYTDLPATDPEEKRIYESIQKALEKKFNALWENDLPLLHNWQSALTEFSFKEIWPVIEKISYFFGILNDAIHHPINAQLLVSGTFPTGATKPGFESMLILHVSRTPLTSINRVIGVLIHEYIHFIKDESARFTVLLRNVLPNEAPTGGYAWKYLISETILKSIASHRANTYLGALLNFSAKERKIDTDISHKNPLNAYSYEFLIRIAAVKLLPTTKKYLDSNREIDAGYMQNAMDILLSLINERDG